MWWLLCSKTTTDASHQTLQVFQRISWWFQDREKNPPTTCPSTSSSCFTTVEQVTSEKKKNIGKAHGLRAAFWPVKHYIYIHLTSAARPYQSPVCFWAAKSMDLPDSNSIVSDDTSTNCFMKLLDLHQVSKIKVMGWCFIGMFPGLPGDHQNHPEYSRIIICCTYNIYIYIYIHWDHFSIEPHGFGNHPY